MSGETPPGNHDSGDYADIFSVGSSTEALEMKLTEVRKEEREIFQFNTGMGVWINRLMPIPVIAAGIIYQVDPSIFSIDTKTSQFSIMLVLILFGQVLWQILLAKRARGLKLTRAGFEMQGIIARRKGQPFKSLEGYDQVSSTLKDEHMQAISHRVFGILAILCYLSTLFGSLFLTPPFAWNEMLEFSTSEPAPFVFSMLVAIGTGLSILVWMAAVMDPTKDFDASEPTGLLATYIPSGHPTLLTAPFSQILLYMMEPGLANRWNQYIREISALSIEQISEIEAIERTLFLYHMNQEGVMEREEVAKELEEIYPLDTVPGIMNHEIFNIEMIHHLFDLTREHNPSFFLTIDRLEHRLMNQLKELKNKPFIFDSEVDRQVHGDQVNLMIYIASLLDSKDVYQIEVISSGFEPQTQSIKLTFDSEQTVHLPKGDSIPIRKEGDDDLIHTMGEALDCGSVIWLSMQPVRKGIFDTQVILKDEDGNIIQGRTMRTSVSKNISQALKQYSGKAGKAGGLAVPLLKVAPSLRKLVGLP
ncbi:MAG: hypothetical protein NZ770_09385 [Candidatus Poseidoniaceae archaeon]|nr:hypothetical protein [Candidatus Poseidoniaceae archaeon]